MSRRPLKANKERFLSYHGVEDRHYFLRSLDHQEARTLVRSLNEREIDSNVNNRRFQQAYICDYLEDLWAISRNSFWKHIALALKHPDGLVLSDNDFHLVMLETERLPEFVLNELLNTIHRLAESQNVQSFDLELHVKLLCKAIGNGHNRGLLTFIQSWAFNLDAPSKEVLSGILTFRRTTTKRYST
mgnify:CR=1 FL=1